jgi:hypothetical protein
VTTSRFAAIPPLAQILLREDQVRAFAIVVDAFDQIGRHEEKLIEKLKIKQ